MLDWTHLWAERFPIPAHALLALAALVLGTLQLVLPKGTRVHRWLGYFWLLLMVGTTLTAIFIHELRLWGKFSPIHILIPVTLIGLWRAINAARQGNIEVHRRIMLLLFFLALVATGLFTLLPGRAMHSVLFGGG